MSVNMVTVPGSSKVKPPDKGSFPIDHAGECRKSMIQYMICLTKNDNQNAKCRQESKDYLACRMEKGLMKKEPWDNLGFSDNEVQKTS